MTPLRMILNEAADRYDFTLTMEKYQITKSSKI